MKKAITLVLAFVMVFALAVPAFADNGIGGQTSGTVEVKYTVAETYVVTIPSAQTFTESSLSSEGNVEASEVKLLASHQLEVSCKSENEYKLKHATEDSAIPYTVTPEGGSVLTGADAQVVLTVTSTGFSANTGSVKLTFATTLDNIAQASSAGEHKDKLTFSCAVSDVN